MTFDSFFETMYGKRVAVLGVGISNMPLLRLMVKYGATVTAYDRKERDFWDKNILDELYHLNVPIVYGQDYLNNLDTDYIFRTPGMRHDLVQISKAVEKGAVLTSEMECFFNLCPCPIIGVTGSDGKTTTTTLISEILKKAGFNVHIGGNIGTPLLDKVPDMNQDDIAVVELSSFQLMTMKSSPNIAVITNLSPNHLDVHVDMAEYVAAKENIFIHQNQGHRLILNQDCPYTKNHLQKAHSTVCLFSPHEAVSNGIGFDHSGGYIYHSENGNITRVLSVGDIKVVGFHNVQNYMAAIAALWSYVSQGSITLDDILYVAHNFNGVEHRIEFVKEVDGVKYYNDSIASSPTRTIAGFHSFDQPVILIAGGSDKYIPFDGLAEEIISHVKALVLVGGTAEKIKTAVEKAAGYNPATLPIITCQSLKEAVASCRALAKPRDVVTMSPACASFDMYKNFMERGNLFKTIVNELN